MGQGESPVNPIACRFPNVLYELVQRGSKYQVGVWKLLHRRAPGVLDPPIKFYLKQIFVGAASWTHGSLFPDSLDLVL